MEEDDTNTSLKANSIFWPNIFSHLLKEMQISAALLAGAAEAAAGHRGRGAVCEVRSIISSSHRGVFLG